MTHLTRVLIAAMAIAVAAFAQITSAQTGQGQAVLTGKVTDVTGAVIVGATVAAVNGNSDGDNSAARLRREATTAADGTFVIDRWPAGTYSVTAHADGFAPSRPQVVTLTAGGHQTLAIELQIASLSETVTTVYGAKTGRSILDTPSSVGVIDNARMDASAMFRIEDVFRQMANVNRADWIDSGIVLRGINSEGVGGPIVLALAASAVILTGNVLWIEVRRPRDPRATPWLHRLLARLTSGVGIGLLAVVPAAFIVSRLLPIDKPDRMTLEAQAFFLIWALFALGALAWPSALTTARLLLALSGILSIAVPIANGLGTGAWLWNSAAREHWIVFAIDACFLAAGVLLTSLAWRGGEFRH